MNHFTKKYVKVLILMVLLLLLLWTLYHLMNQSNTHKTRLWFPVSNSFFNDRQIVEISQANLTINQTTSSTMSVDQTMNTTTTAARRITIDPAELLLERVPSSSPHRHNLSDGTLAVFVFHTRHFVIANLQFFLLRKLATNLIALELFLDGSASQEMRQVADRHHAGLHSLPSNLDSKAAAPSERNGNVVNWAIATKGKEYLRNGTAILVLDGDVFPLSPFDSVTLLNSRDIVCRKHPATFARFCWIGLICLAPQLYSTIDDFNVSPTGRGGQFYDAGGRTIEYLLRYENTSFSWMKETILLENDKELFWGAVDNDITWIRKHFDRCDKCGPEIFFSPFDNSSAVFYHMISGTSEWRFANQDERRQSIYDTIMQSPYGLNGTKKFNEPLLISELNASVGKIQKMRTIPYHGNLSCESVCRKSS